MDRSTTAVARRPKSPHQLQKGFHVVPRRCRMGERDTDNDERAVCHEVEDEEDEADPSSSLEATAAAAAAAWLALRVDTMLLRELRRYDRPDERVEEGCRCPRLRESFFFFFWWKTSLNL